MSTPFFKDYDVHCLKHISQPFAEQLRHHSCYHVNDRIKKKTRSIDLSKFFAQHFK